VRHAQIVRLAIDAIALLSNLEASEADATQVLLHHQGQEAVERCRSAFKAPLAVAAIYLKNNRRITAMITVVCLALLIFSLIERQVRAALRALGRTTVAGLYTNRPAVLIADVRKCRASDGAGRRRRRRSLGPVTRGRRAAARS
jgi:transposase